MRNYISEKLFSHNACFFYLIVIYNSIHEKLILEFTGIKVVYQARILKVILKVRKLGKIGWYHRKQISSNTIKNEFLEKKICSEHFNKNQLI